MVGAAAGPSQEYTQREFIAKNSKSVGFGQCYFLVNQEGGPFSFRIRPRASSFLQGINPLGEWMHFGGSFSAQACCGTERFKCEAGSEPNFSDGGCKSLGFYFDGEVPEGGMVKSACDAECAKRWSLCGPGPSAQVGYSMDTSLPKSKVADCKQRANCVGGGCEDLGYLSNSETPSGAVLFSDCVRDCVPRWTECDPETGSVAVGNSMELSLPTSQVPNCVNYYDCDPDTGCQDYGYLADGYTNPRTDNFYEGKCPTVGCSHYTACSYTPRLKFTVTPAWGEQHKQSVISQCWSSDCTLPGNFGDPYLNNFNRIIAGSLYGSGAGPEGDTGWNEIGYPNIVCGENVASGCMSVMYSFEAQFDIICGGTVPGRCSGSPDGFQAVGVTIKQSVTTAWLFGGAGAGNPEPDCSRTYRWTGLMPADQTGDGCSGGWNKIFAPGGAGVTDANIGGSSNSSSGSGSGFEVAGHSCVLGGQGVPEQTDPWYDILYTPPRFEISWYEDPAPQSSSSSSSSAASSSSSSSSAASSSSSSTLWVRMEPKDYNIPSCEMVCGPPNQFVNCTTHPWLCYEDKTVCECGEDGNMCVMGSYCLLENGEPCGDPNSCCQVGCKSQYDQLAPTSAGNWEEGGDCSSVGFLSSEMSAAAVANRCSRYSCKQYGVGDMTRFKCEIDPAGTYGSEEECCNFCCGACDQSLGTCRWWEDKNPEGNWNTGSYYNCAVMSRKECLSHQSERAINMLGNFLGVDSLGSYPGASFSCCGQTSNTEMCSCVGECPSWFSCPTGEREYIRTELGVQDCGCEKICDPCEFGKYAKYYNFESRNCKCYDCDPCPKGWYRQGPEGSLVASCRCLSCEDRYGPCGVGTYEVNKQNNCECWSKKGKKTWPV
jgi:hypothetical protein